jgi:hypothetical protein
LERIKTAFYDNPGAKELSWESRYHFHVLESLIAQGCKKWTLPFVFFFYFLHTQSVDFRKINTNSRSIGMNVWGLSKKILGIGLLALPLTMSTTLTGCLTDDDKDSTPDTTKSTPLSAEKTLSVGAQGATLGSVMDIDAATEAAMVLNSAAANAAQESIDLVFLFYGNAFYIHNAVGARAAGKAQTPPINLVDSYDLTKIKDIKMVKVTTKPKDQEAAKAALSGTLTTGSAITGGEMFVIQSTGGKVALVTVGTIVGTDNKANASFKVSINSI